MSRHLKLPTILVVADNPAVSIWIKKHLEHQFFIIGAETKKAAMDALHSTLDFIIIDSGFEFCNALELAQEIYTKTVRTTTPIFLITGKLKKSYRDKAKKAGVTEFLNADLDLDELLIRIEMGKKAAAIRQKTEDVTRAIKLPKLSLPHTSLKKKFVLNDRALRLLADAKKEDTPVALLLIRIDHFSKDTHSKPVLESFETYINHLLRKKDVLIPSSQGGYILLLSNTLTDSGKKVAERLRAHIQRQKFDAVSLTVSIAVTSLEASEKGFHQMLDAATKSLKTKESTNLIITLDQEAQ